MVTLYKYKESDRKDEDLKLFSPMVYEVRDLLRKYNLNETIFILDFNNSEIRIGEKSITFTVVGLSYVLSEYEGLSLSLSTEILGVINCFSVNSLSFRYILNDISVDLSKGYIESLGYFRLEDGSYSVKIN